MRNHGDHGGGSWEKEKGKDVWHILEVMSTVLVGELEIGWQKERGKKGYLRVAV